MDIGVNIVAKGETNITTTELLESRPSGVDIPQYIAPTSPEKLPFNPSTEVIITASTSNTSYIQWGFSTSVPNVLDAGQTVILPITNSNLIYVSGNGTDSVGGSVLK